MSGPVTDVAHPPDGVAGMAGSNASLPPRRFVLPEAVTRAAPRIGWALMSVGLFAGIWELLAEGARPRSGRPDRRDRRGR
jgi:hypothetical protein